ncbi:MAG: PAS domain S-box protein [Methanoregula sp.]|nr:PAS domain S-box protein [Methanoregula sp.]
MSKVQPPEHSVTDLKPGDHACCIYDTDEEHRNIITPFLRRGLEQNEKVVYIADARDPRPIINYLKSDGVDVEHYQKKGQFTILTSSDTYLKRGVFDPDGMISILSSDTQKALDEGYTALRVTAEMSWALRGLPGSELLMEYENKLDTFITGSKFLAICQYDRRCFSNEQFHDVLVVHPFAIIGISVCNNFYYVPPKERVKENPSGKQLNSWISNLKDYNNAEGALRESEEKFRLIADNTPDSIWIFDMDMQLHYISPSVKKMKGFTIEETLSQSLEEMMIPESLESLMKRFHQEMALEASGTADLGRTVLFEIEEYCKTGATIRVENSVTLLRDAQGRLVRMLGISRDITERRRAEEALRESEELYRSLFEGVPTGRYLTTPLGQILDINPALVRLLGYPDRESLLAVSVFDLYLDPGNRNQWLALIEREGIVRDFEVQFRKYDGTIIWVQDTGEAVRDDSGQVIYYNGNIEDITERKRMEEALRESEERYRNVVEDQTEFVCRFLPDGTHIFVNDAYCRYFDKKREEIIGHRFKPVLHPEDREIVARHIASLTPQNPVMNIDQRIIMPDGSTRWQRWSDRAIFNADGEVAEYQSVGRDNTKQKEAGRALLESETRLHAVVHGSPIPKFVIDKNHCILYWNKALEEHSGIKASEVVGTNQQWRAFYPHERPCMADLLVDGSIEKIPQWYDVKCSPSKFIEGAYEATDFFPNLGTAGTWLYITAAPIRDTEGNIIGAVETLEDITDRKLAEEAIRASLAEKEILLWEIHHRVKNNLTGILSLIDLQISTISDPVYISHLKNLETRVRSMALVHESLFHTKDLTHINIAGYTENLTRYLFQVHGIGVDIRCRIDMGDITMPIETAIPCGLVMSEIVTNALKYAFPGTFSCNDQRGEPCTIALTLHREGINYRLMIADNGTGMPEGIDVTMTHSLGRYLIMFIVKHQLRGSLEISTARGTAYTIRFPEPAVKERHTDE